MAHQKRGVYRYGTAAHGVISKSCWVSGQVWRRSMENKRPVMLGYEEGRSLRRRRTPLGVVMGADQVKGPVGQMNHLLWQGPKSIV